MTSPCLKVGYVREHFSSPLLQFAEVDAGQTFTLVECPSGTGQLIARLAADEIDIAIALTDPLISGIAKGSKAYKLIGSFVSTPLNWYAEVTELLVHPSHEYRAVITGTDAIYKEISDLKGTTLGISRPGSGSQTMAYVMALQQGWPTDDLKFQVNNDIRGLLNSVNDGSTSAFMWEWFTTKPFVDAGEARFIGSVPTPWPSWLIAGHPDRAFPDSTNVFITKLTDYVVAFNSEESRATKNVAFIQEKFGYPKKDIEAWLKTVSYPRDCAEIPKNVIESTLSVLEKAGVVKLPENGFDINDFVERKIVELT